MRRPRLLGLIALTLPAFLLPAACEDSSSSSSGGTFSPEAGPGFDAGGNPDTSVPPADAAVDQVVAAKGVTMTVIDSAAGPKSGVRVIAHDASGAVIGDATTNAAGKVAYASPPSMITVLTSQVNGATTFSRPVTFTAVADGDNLTVVAPAPATDSTLLATFNVGLQPSALVATAASFSVYEDGYCFGSTNSTDVAAPVMLYDGCVNPQNALLASATDGAGILLGFGFLKNVAKPAANATVAVALPAFAAPGTTTMTVANLSGTLKQTYARLAAIANETAFDVGNYTGNLGDGGLNFSTATGFADAYQSVVFFEASSSASTFQEQILLRREPTTAPASMALATFDYATTLPAISAYALKNPSARPDLAVTSAAALTGADAGFLSLDWSTAAGNGTWLFVVPPTTTTLKVPALPADATAFTPGANTYTNTALFFDASQLTGYAAVKALPIPAAQGGLELANPDTTKPLPAAGTVRITRYVDNSRG